MIRRKTSNQTIGESRWPDTRDFVELAKTWKPDATSIILKFIWSGYDVCYKEVLSRVNISQADDQLERELTQILDLYIRKGMQGFEPFTLQHESYEMELRGTHRPKQYDLAFVWLGNPRAKYPLEAKVLRSDNSVTDYVNEITGNYLTCRYAPFSSEVGMLGYLLKGSPTIAFHNIATAVHIATAVPCTLSTHPDFSGREHRVSDHERSVPTGERYPVKFRCHHLLLQLIKKSNVQKATAKRKSSKKTP